jgi:hypothetical protein
MLARRVARAGGGGGRCRCEDEGTGDTPGTGILACMKDIAAGCCNGGATGIPDGDEAARRATGGIPEGMRGAG